MFVSHTDIVYICVFSGEITVFFLIFYACLAGFFAGMLSVFYYTLDWNEPRLKGSDSLLKQNPGMDTHRFENLTVGQVLGVFTVVISTYDSCTQLAYKIVSQNKGWKNLLVCSQVLTISDFPKRLWFMIPTQTTCMRLFFTYYNVTIIICLHILILPTRGGGKSEK